MKKSEIAAEILRLLAERDVGKTICPSEVLPTAQRQDPELMEVVRDVARDLVTRGKIEITQKGMAVDPLRLHGPIRLRLKR